LKPNNIGFIGNTVQIFDFGLSRELPALDTSVPFLMSGKVGTLRYMAPEVARHEHYNVSADIYSFAMVSYELLSLEKPFEGWTRDMHAQLVCNRGVRPDTANTMHPVPAEMKLILEQAWSGNPTCRGTMSHIGAQVLYLESRQVQYLAEQQLQVGFHPQLLSPQPQPQQQPMPLSFPPPLMPTTHHISNNSLTVHMIPSYDLANTFPVKTFPRGACVSLDDSMGTIDTGSLSTESESYWQ
jgi:serine/threonine protein kinase